MTKKRRKELKYSSFFLFIFVFISTSFAHASEKDVIGVWDVESKDAKMEIYRCGDRFCGRLAWLKDPNYTAEENRARVGQPKTDDNNPTLALRNRPLLGLQIMSNFRYVRNDNWVDGKVYDPESGKVYSANMHLVSKDRLDLRGYIMFSIFGRTNTWTRSKHPDRI